MGVWGELVHRPRRVWVRRAMFQVHLWMGLLVSLYVVVIALSGALLVFEDELTATTLPAGMHGYEAGRGAGVEAVVRRFAGEFPGAGLTTVTMPTAVVPAFQLEGSEANGRALRVVADAQTGELRRVGRSWVEWVRDLHVYLLLPHGYGAQVNGVGAGVLLVLTATGMVLWWPGLKLWARGLRVNFRTNWRRMNYDLHSAVGFWTLTLVAWWGVSGVYFGFYQQVRRVVGWFSPVKNMMGPVTLPASAGAGRVGLGELLRVAREVSPAGRVASVSDPLLKGHQVYVSMDLGAAGDFLHRDLLVLDAGTGRVLSVWHYAQKNSAGDWVLWLMHPLHFGTVWGLGVKIVWAAAGVGLAVLSVTGVLMYWNRFLRLRWRMMTG